MGFAPVLTDAGAFTGVESARSDPGVVYGSESVRAAGGRLSLTRNWPVRWRALPGSIPPTPTRFSCE
jgi:hypothetical protein